MEQDRLNRQTLRQQKNGTYKPTNTNTNTSTIGPVEMLMEQITDEIKERTEYIDDLKDNAKTNGNGANKNQQIILKITGEISERIAQLKKLEKEM